MLLYTSKPRNEFTDHRLIDRADYSNLNNPGPLLTLPAIRCLSLGATAQPFGDLRPSQTSGGFQSPAVLLKV